MTVAKCLTKVRKRSNSKAIMKEKKCYLTAYETTKATVFCSSLVRSEPTSVSSEELQFEGEKQLLLYKYGQNQMKHATQIISTFSTFHQTDL